MARKPQDEAEIARLIGRIEGSRAEVAEAACRLRERLDVPARVRDSLRSHPKVWFGASMVAGLWAAGRVFRRRPAAEAAPARRGLFALAAAGAASVAKTLVRDWVLRESRKRLEGISRR